MGGLQPDFTHSVSLSKLSGSIVIDVNDTSKFKPRIGEEQR